MKKILFISPRDPFSGRFSGDVIRAEKFLNFLKKKNLVTSISPGDFNLTQRYGNLKIIKFKKENPIIKLFYILISILKFKPLQLGYFYSGKMDNYIKENYKNFDIVFCQSVRAANYVIKYKNIKKILDMGDLYSNNYYQTYKSKGFFNLARLIYFIESKLMKNYENLCFKRFDKIFLFSKKEISALKINKNKIKQINFGIEKIKNKFRFSKKNYKIIFIGNIKYLPNRIACKSFIEKELPKIKKIHKNIEFHIIGEISRLDKFLWQKAKLIKIHGKVKKLDPLLSNVFCGLANLNISSGIQTKLLTYMSYGIPSISSKKVLDNFDALKPSFLPIYTNNDQLIKLILKLKVDKKYSQSISKKSLSKINYFKWGKILRGLNKL